MVYIRLVVAVIGQFSHEVIRLKSVIGAFRSVYC